MRKNIKNLLKKYGVFPKKRFGQNFLISENVLRKIVEAGEISKRDTVLEIGPGVGNLTIKLAERAKKVIAVEKDERMVKILSEVLKCSNLRNIQIVQGDVLKLDINSYIHGGYKIIANIPYYLTSRLIRKFLEEKRKPKLIVLMIQKEVAQRICSKPPKMNLLAISVQFYAKPEILFYVSKNCFWPRPKVDSSVIKITPKKILSKSDFDNLFFKIIKAGFSHPRKQLINNLPEGLKIEKEKVKIWLSKNKINPTQRAETLSIEDWINLAKDFKI